MDKINLFRFFIALAIMPFILFFEALASSHEAPTALPVVIMTHMKPPTHATGCWLNSIYKEAFQRLGYLMQYKHVPAAQAAAMTDHSESDGELGRTEYYGQSHPNVVRVDEPHLTVNFCVYTRKKPTQKLDWQTLKETDGIIGHGRGIEKIALELNSLK
nr:hypothetical protein [uncultured Pseudodesulfovibrio sp.]